MNVTRIIFVIITPLITACADLSGWQYEESVDAITDQKRVVAVLEEDGAGGAWIETGCGREGLFIVFNFQDTSENVVARVDKNPPISIPRTFNFDMTHLALVTGETAASLLSEIQGGNRLLARRDNMSALSQTDHYFDINGEFEPVNKATSDCLNVR